MSGGLAHFEDDLADRRRRGPQRSEDTRRLAERSEAT